MSSQLTRPFALSKTDPLRVRESVKTGTSVDKQDARFAYVGTYTRGAPGGWSEAAQAVPPVGICVLKVLSDGKMTLVQTVRSANPAFVALHPAHHTLYATNEITDYAGREDGSLEAYQINEETGRLSLLNRISSHGSMPAHLSIDPAGKCLILANYGNSSIVVFGIHEDGSLGVPLGMLECKGSGPDAVRQTRSHPHSVTFDPTGRFIAAADLGTDQVMIIALDDRGLTLTSTAREAPGSGPRQVAFHPDGKNLYVVNEIAGSVSVFKFDPGTGKLGGQIQTISTLPDDFPANGNKNAAGIAIHPSGKFLYVSNRKTEDHPMADSIAAYRIDQVTGRLTLVGYTFEGIACPRTIHFDLNGRWLYVLNQKGDSIIQYAIRPETGELIPAGVTTEIKVPVCIAFKQ